MQQTDLGERGERLREAASQARFGVSEKLGDVGSALMLKAVLIGVFGICALVWPGTALNLLIVAFGVLLVLDGVFGLISMLRANEHGAFLGQSILSLVIGGLLLFWPDATLGIVLRLIGIWALLHGVALFLSLKDLPDGDACRDTQRTVALVVTVVGAVLLFWPNVGTVALSWLIGIAALIIAGVLFWLASRMKALKQRVGAGLA